MIIPNIYQYSKTDVYDEDLVISTFNELPTKIKKLYNDNAIITIGGATYGTHGQFYLNRMQCKPEFVNKPKKLDEKSEIRIETIYASNEYKQFYREVFFHEVGHLIKEWLNLQRYYNYKLVKDFPSFKPIFQKEKKFFKEKHFKEDPSEFFAESFCRYILKDSNFMKSCPSTVRYIDIIINIIIPKVY